MIQRCSEVRSLAEIVSAYGARFDYVHVNMAWLTTADLPPGQEDRQLATALQHYTQTSGKDGGAETLGRAILYSEAARLGRPRKGISTNFPIEGLGVSLQMMPWWRSWLLGRWICFETIRAPQPHRTLRTRCGHAKVNLVLDK